MNRNLESIVTFWREIVRERERELEKTLFEKKTNRTACIIHQFSPFQKMLFPLLLFNATKITFARSCTLQIVHTKSQMINNSLSPSVSVVRWKGNTIGTKQRRRMGCFFNIEIYSTVGWVATEVRIDCKYWDNSNEWSSFVHFN